MKKFLLSALILVGLTARVSLAGITGSAHDFADPNQYPKNWSNGQICVPCHIPHNATVKDSSGNDLGGPLWNHTLSAQGTSYTMYDALNPKLDANGNPVLDTNNKPVVTGNVDQNSILCLSCHDGTIALDSFGGGAGIAGAMPGTPGQYGSANFGTDLTLDHPMGERAVVGGPTFKQPTYMVAQSLRDGAGIMPARLMADGSTQVVGCTSCHEPHNRMGGRVPGITHMLWAPVSGAGTTVDSRSVSGSVLCMNCHKK